MKTVIIIPTYNEADNITKLVNYLEEKTFPAIDKEFQMHILVVDDNSPDGTAKVVKDLQKKYKNLHLLINPKKQGLGAAYLKGMEKAVDEMKADLMFEMDADFSHDPNVIPYFLEQIQDGSDLVLGSRYMKGGSIPKDWGIHRKFLSLVGNNTIRLIITNFKIKDWTTGYRAIRTPVFQQLRHEMKRKEFSGYTFQIGFLHKTLRKGFKISEVPIQFVDRKFGKSKLGAEYVKNTLFYIITIRIKELQTILKFVTVGLTSFLVNVLVLEFLYRSFGVSPDNAAAIGAELAIITNFVLHNLWTFKHKKITDKKQLFKKFVIFNLTSLGSVLLQKALVWAGIQLYGESLYFLYFVTAVFIGMIFNFFIYTKVIWKQ
jgi:dolichol-phosphate mannosyltransferase